MNDIKTLHVSYVIYKNYDSLLLICSLTMTTERCSHKDKSLNHNVRFKIDDKI